MAQPYTEFRRDGWPLCPYCGEDELWSAFAWDGNDPKPPMQAWIDHGLRCYKCNWDSEQPRAPSVICQAKAGLPPLVPLELL